MVVVPELRANSANTITSAAVIQYRPMTMSDLDNVPIDCQGMEAAVRSRIADLGASAILAFDGEQHVGQLQFRRYDQALRSPAGIMDPSYWGDFQQADTPPLPEETLNLFCYHVGQLEAGDARDPRYQGRGIGVALLEEFLRWADATGVEATVAKALAPFRPLGVLMGGHPASVYEDHGFEVAARWCDRDLRDRLPNVLAGEHGDGVARELRDLRDHGLTLDALAEVAMVVRRRT